MSSSKAEPKQQQNSRSIFDLPPNFFDSCRLFSSSSSSSTELESFETTEIAINGESLKEDGEEEKNKKVDVFIPSWSCHTCNAEFDSLQEQRSHFKSDFHRLNVKLKIAGKSSIKEEDFDESASDSLFRDNDISSISGSEDENERASFPIGDSFKKAGESNKQKVVIRLRNGELVSFWKCLLLKESENITYDNDKLVSEENNGFLYLREKELVERLKSLTLEPRDKSKLRIVLLASGGHFAACVFDGNSVVAHKTFHRYVVRAKAGKKQSSKDASGNAASSAGASLRRYNELALKKEIQELMAAWKPYLDASTCVFISAPSKNKQLLFDAEKAYFTGAVRHIPFTVRRPTLKEAKRIYGYVTNINYEVVEKRSESSLNDDLLLAPSEVEPDHIECNEGKMKDIQISTETSEECQIHEDSERTERELLKTSTLLHEAAKSGNAEQTLELLAQGLDPCIIDERGRTPYMLATDKEVRNTFRRFMALNLDKWDWHTAKVPSPLTKEMEESQAAKQAEKDAKRKAKAKELKKVRKAKEKAQAQAALAKNVPTVSHNQRAAPVSVIKAQATSSSGVRLSKEEELKRAQDAEREKRAAAAEKRIAAAAALNTQRTSNSEPATGAADDISCSCCNVSLAGKVPFHRYHYKYCSTSCMHVHKEMLEDG